MRIGKQRTVNLIRSIVLNNNASLSDKHMAFHYDWMVHPLYSNHYAFLPIMTVEQRFAVEMKQMSSVLG
jgi:hypothetical protein